MEAVVNQWTPAAKAQAHRIAKSFRATRQERSDLFDLIPATLCRLASDGQLASDTNAALAFTVIWRALVKGWGGGLLGIREWRSGEVVIRLVDGRQRYLRRPIGAFSDVWGDDAYGYDSVSENLPGRDDIPVFDATDAIAAMVRVLKLTRREASALRALAAGMNGAEYARKRGLTRAAISAAVCSIRRKCCGYEEWIRDLLA